MVTVIGIDKPSKRVQMVRGLRLSKTAITAFVDDDIIWPSTYLPMVLAAFEDPAVGAAGSCQRMLRVANPNVWHILGAMYLERRNFEFSATLHMDGGTSCLSGRTSFHRTFILQNDAFINGFLEETWMGWVPLMTADDDNFVTRWLVNHGWKIRVQYCKEAELSTTLEASPMFIFQCVRWARSNWRSNTTSMFVDRVVWRLVILMYSDLEARSSALTYRRKQPWSSFALHLAMLNPPAAIMDGLLAYLLYLSTHEIEPKLLPSVLTGFVLWLLFTKLVKLLPHFHRYPKDLRFFPAIVLFGYFHGLVKLYALLTIHKVSGSSYQIKQVVSHSMLTSYRPTGGDAKSLLP